MIYNRKINKIKEEIDIKHIIEVKKFKKRVNKVRLLLEMKENYR